MSAIQPHNGIILRVNHDPFNNDEFPQTLNNFYELTPKQKLLIDLSYISDMQGFSKIQTVFIDNYDNDSDLILENTETSQRIVCKKKTQGYYPILTYTRPKFILFNSSELNQKVNLQFMNFIISQGAW